MAALDKPDHLVRFCFQAVWAALSACPELAP